MQPSSDQSQAVQTHPPNLKPTEKQIQDMLFSELLPKFNPDSLFVKNWGGWSFRGTGNRKEQTRFYREFDIAMFTQSGSSEVLLTGYEVKGFEKKTGRPPSFAEGLDQALVLLQQGADFAYLVHPEPEREGDKKDLKELCDKSSPSVGLIFLPHELGGLGLFSLLPYRGAVQNYYTHRDRKRSMLSSVITGGLRDEISNIPLWCKRL